MAIGLSTACYYPETTEESLKKVGELGAETAEIFINSFSELEPSFIRELHSISAHYGTKIKSIHPFMSFAEHNLFFSDYIRRYYDSLEFYKRYFEAASILGAKVIVIHGSRIPCPVSDEIYFERFAGLSEVAKGFGLRIAQENVVHFVSQSPGFLERMAAAVGEDFGLVFDIKQAVRAGFNPAEFAKKLKEHIVHIHISDHNEKTDCLPPGLGDFDFDAFFQEMQGCDYSGDYIIELYNHSYGSDEMLLISLDAMKKKLANIKK